ncbi:MAG TPA: hypothetical protein VHY36_10395 [Steroidobacteraceae bacterium]|nr:hypothetical protein [Steroidobacteraceae bacterium]
MRIFSAVSGQLASLHEQKWAPRVSFDVKVEGASLASFSELSGWISEADRLLVF